MGVRIRHTRRHTDADKQPGMFSALSSSDAHTSAQVSARQHAVSAFLFRRPCPNYSRRSTWTSSLIFCFTLVCCAQQPRVIASKSWVNAEEKFHCSSHKYSKLERAAHRIRVFFNTESGGFKRLSLVFRAQAAEAYQKSLLLLH